MAKLFIEDLPIKDKTVLMRVDFNVPLNGDSHVTDATRIEAALPSIRYVLDQGGALILMSHLGRPNGMPSPELSLAPVAKVLSTLIDRPVALAKSAVSDLQPGNVVLLENLRFHRAETHPEEDPSFAKELASYGDLYVNDAFGTAHRKHSSTYTIAQYFPEKAAAGYLMEKEIHFLGDALTHPKRPFYALLGGAKVSTKIGVIKRLLTKVDKLMIGGGMAYTFFKALGIEIGNSLVEEDFLPLAEALLKEEGGKIILPLDCLVATECSEDATTKLITAEEGIPKGYEGLDIGPKTIEQFGHLLLESATFLWNGPVGVYELEPFARGTLSLAQLLNGHTGISIAGGGDLVAALNQAGVQKAVTHISTGGGATLEYIEHETLPCIDALTDN